MDEEQGPERFVKKVEGHIAKGERVKLFTEGCCYQFALRCLRSGIGKLAYVAYAEDPRYMAHVFVVTDSDGKLGFDCKGHRTVTEIVGDLKADKCYAADESKVEEMVKKKPLPKELSKQVNDLADEWIEHLLKQSSSPLRLPRQPGQRQVKLP